MLEFAADDARRAERGCAAAALAQRHSSHACARRLARLYRALQRRAGSDAARRAA
jgi:hypothetical protein